MKSQAVGLEYPYTSQVDTYVQAIPGICPNMEEWTTPEYEGRQSRLRETWSIPRSRLFCNLWSDLSSASATWR